MRDFSKVSWPKVRRFFFDLSSCKTKKELLFATCVEIQKLIPYDETAGVFRTSDGVNLEGVGKSDACTAVFNSYYKNKIPQHSTLITDWRNVDEEFTVDFMFKYGMYKSLAHYIPSQQVTIRIQRSRYSPLFSQSELSILDLANKHLNDLYSAFGKRIGTPWEYFSKERIAQQFRNLSKREVDVCWMIAGRFDTAEIASYLFLSRRTIEKYLEVIYDKLNVHSREQLRWRLGVLSPAGNMSDLLVNTSQTGRCRMQVKVAVQR